MSDRTQEEKYREPIKKREEQIRGLETEIRFFKAMELLKDGRFYKPPWLVLVRESTWDEDQYEATDAVALTLRKAVPIQIKGSRKYLEKFDRNNPDFEGLIVIISAEATTEEIIEQTILGLKEFLNITD